MVNSGAKVEKNMIIGVGRDYKAVGRDAIYPKSNLIPRKTDYFLLPRVQK